MRWVSRASEESRRITKKFIGEFNLRTEVAASKQQPKESEMGCGASTLTCDGCGQIGYHFCTCRERPDSKSKESEMIKWDAEKITALQTENARLKVELEAHKNVGNINIGDFLKVTAERNRLRAELEALRPKPVVHSCVYGVEMGKYSKHWPEFTAGAGKQNLELTFHDGKLVTAEVINQGEVK